MDVRVRAHARVHACVHVCERVNVSVCACVRACMRSEQAQSGFSTRHPPQPLQQRFENGTDSTILSVKYKKSSARMRQTHGRGPRGIKVPCSIGKHRNQHREPARLHSAAWQVKGHHWPVYASHLAPTLASPVHWSETAWRMPRWKTAKGGKGPGARATPTEPQEVRGVGRAALRTRPWCCAPQTRPSIIRSHPDSALCSRGCVHA